MPIEQNPFINTLVCLVPILILAAVAALRKNSLRK